MTIYFVKCGDMYLADLLKGEIDTVVLKSEMTGAEIFEDLSIAQGWADKTGGHIESYVNHVEMKECPVGAEHSEAFAEEAEKLFSNFLEKTNRQNLFQK